MKNFFGNVFVTFRGALVGQLIPVIAMPFISRLYDPTEYGLFASILSISVIFGAICMLQLDVAVVLPEDDKIAEDLTKTSLQTGFYLTSIFLVLIALAHPFISSFEGFEHLGGWILLAPVLGFLFSSIQLTNFIATRFRYFNEIGLSAAGLQIVNCGVAIGIGLFNPALWGLIVARISGQMAGILVYKKSLIWLWRIIKNGGFLSFSAMWQTIKDYRKFPLFTLPHTLISTLSRELIVVILIFFHHPQAAGFYALVRSVLMMPVSLLSTSVGQIFYREASSALENPAFRNFAYRLMIAIACIVTPACVYIANWGPEIFSIVFGEEWREAGVYAKIYMPLSLLFILCGWLSRIFEVAYKQDTLFRIQLFFDAISLTALIYALSNDHGPVFAITCYVVVQCIYLLTNLVFVFQIMRFSTMKYIALIAVAVFAACMQYVLYSIIQMVDLGMWASFALETALTGTVAIGLIYLFWKHFQKNFTHELARDGHSPL